MGESPLTIQWANDVYIGKATRMASSLRPRNSPMPLRASYAGPVVVRPSSSSFVAVSWTFCTGPPVTRFVAGSPIFSLMTRA